MMKASALASLFFGLLFLGISGNAANAAPQALALVNSGGEVTLQCHDDECIASLSSYCLQKSRSVPASGTAYNFADSKEVRLVGIKKDGSRVLLDPADELRIAALRRQLAVSVAIPKSRPSPVVVELVTLI